MLSRQAFDKFMERYQPEYCQMLIAHCDKGNSVESFAAVIDGTPELFPFWAREYVEFEMAMHIGYWKSYRKIEELGMKGGIHHKTYELIMRNRFNWKDDTEQALKALAKMSTQDLEETARRILRADVHELKKIPLQVQHERNRIQSKASEQE